MSDLDTIEVAIEKMWASAMLSREEKMSGGGEQAIDWY